MAIALAAVTAIGSPFAPAATWDPIPGVAGPGDGAISGGGGFWDLFAPNWTTDGGLFNTPWVNGDDAVFGGATGGTVTLVNGGVTARSLTFDPTSSATRYTISSQTPAAVLTLTSPLITVNQDATIDATLGGSAGLTKVGAGTLTLGGTNTFSGTLTMAGGRLRVASAANIGNASALSFGGGALEATGPLAFAGPVGINAAGGTIVLSNPASAVTFSGVVSGAGPLVVDGTGGGSLALTSPANFTGSSNTFTGNVTLVGGGSVALGHGIAAPAGQVFTAAAGTLTLGNSIAGATVTTSAGSTAQATGAGVVRLFGRAAAPGVGVSVAGDLLASAGGRIEVGDGLDDASHVRLINTSRLTADGGTIVLRPRGAALAVDATTVNALAVRNGGVLALGAGATGDLVIGADVNQAGAWTLANQSGQTLRVLGGVQDSTAGLTLRAEGGATRYEVDTVTVGSAAVSGTLAVDLRGGLIDINNAAAGKTFVYAPGHVVSGWGQLGTSAANQTHVISAGGGATFYASGPAPLAPTLAIVGGFNESGGAKASFRIGDNNGLSLTVPNASAVGAYVVNSVAVDPQSFGSVARFVVGGGVVQANAGAFTNAANRLRFDVQNGGTLISNIAGTGSLLVNGPGSTPVNLSGDATFSTTSPTFLVNANESIGGTGTMFGISGLSGTSPTNLTLNGQLDLNGTLAASVNAASTGTIRLDAGESLALTAAADLLSTSLVFGGTTPAVARLEVAAPTGSTVRLGTGGSVTTAGGFTGTREFRVTSGTFQVDVNDAATVTIDGANQLSVDRTANGTADRALLGTLGLNGGAFVPGATAATTTVSAGATLAGFGAYGHTNLADAVINQGTVRAQGGQLNVTATGGIRGGGTWDPNGQVMILSGAIQDVAAGSPTQFRVAGAAGGRVQIATAGTYTGGTVIDGSAGASPVTLRVGAANALGTGAISINTGVLQILSDAGLNFSTLPITVTGGGASQIRYDRAGTSTASVTHRLGDLTIGGQTLSLTGPATSSYVHSLTVNSLTVTPAGATMVQQGPNSVSVSSLALNGNLALTLATPSFTVGTLSGSGSIVRTIPSGTLVLNRAASNFSGNLTTAVGTTNLSASNVLAGGTYLFTNSGATTGTVNITAAGALNATSGTQTAGQFNLNVGGALDGTTHSLTGGNTNANATNALGTGTVLLGGGNLFLRRDAGTAFGGTVTAAGPGVGNLTVDRANGGSGTGGQHTIAALNVVDRQLNLFQSNGYTLGVTGVTTISGTGASVIDNDISLLTLPTLQLNGPLLLTGTGTTTIGSLGGSGAFKMSAGNPVTITGAAQAGFSSNLQLNTGSLDLNHPAALTGGSATVAGGTLNLNAATTAPLALTSGFIHANVSDALGGGALPITNGTLFANTADALGGSTINLTGGNVTATAAGALGSSQVNLTNTTLALRSDTAAAFGGSVSVGGTNFSTISVANRTAAGGSGNRLSINTLSLGGQTLNVTGADNDVFTVLNPVMLVGTAPTTINTTAADAFFQGSLNGAGPLVKSGVRTLTIDGGGNFGAASVSAGTLVVNGAWTTSGATVGTATGPATLELGGGGVNSIAALTVNSGTLRIAKPVAQDALPAALAVAAGTNGDVTLEYSGYANGRLANAVNVDSSLAARKLTLAARSGTAVGQVSIFTHTGLIGRTGANALTVVAQADGTQIDGSNNVLRSPSRMVLGGTQTFTSDLVHGGGVVVGKGPVPASGSGPFGASANPLAMTVMDSSVGGMVADGQSNTTFSKAVTAAAPRARLGAYYNTGGLAVQTVNFNGGFAWNDATVPLYAVNTSGAPAAAASVSFWNGLFADPGTILQFNIGAVIDNVLTASGTNVTAAAPVYAGGGGTVRFNSNFNEGTYRNLASAVGLSGTLGVLDGTTVQSNTPGHHFDGVDLRTGTYQVGNVNQLLTGGFAVNASPFEAARTTGNLITDFNLTLGGVGAAKAFAIAGGQTLAKSGAAALSVTGDQLHAAGSTLAASGGTVNLNTDAGANAAGGPTNKMALAVSNAGTTVNLNVTQHVTQVAIAGGLVKLAASTPAGSRVLDATGVSVTGGQLDLTNNRLIVDYTGGSPINSIRQQLAAGFNIAGARWTGPGIVSSNAAADATLGLGFGEASEVVGAAGGAFGPETVDPTSVIVRLTKNGDATLDGTVNFDDLLQLAKYYNSAGAHWSRGDFDYNATVDFDDLLILAKYYNAVLPSEPIPGATAEFSADVAAAFAAAVPEPSGLGFVGAVAVVALARRRRRGG